MTTFIVRDLLSDRERIVFQGNPAAWTGLLASGSVPIGACLRSGEHRRGIMVLDIDTGQARVVHDTAPDTSLSTDSLAVPTWSPNGRALLVNRTENPGLTSRPRFCD